MKKQIFKLIKEELEREEKTINLIASENYANPDILKATGSIFTNKYAEGYPEKRYYGGCQVVDKVENYAIEQARKLFNATHVNVQPHSGSSANMAVYFSQLKHGETILAMSLSAGGHLTHGHKVNFSGKLFNFVHYGVDPETEMLDYDEIEILVNQHKPKMLVAGASAYSRFIDFARLGEIAEDNNCILFVDMAHIAGLVAAELHPSPIPCAHIVSSTTHKTLRGPRGGFICCQGDFKESIDKSVMPGCQGGPLMNVIAAKAIAFEQAQSKDFKKYQEQVIKNAKIMAKTFKDLGYKIVSNGTDNHLFLIDLRQKNGESFEKITGKLVEETLEKCSIILNRNTIPFDTQSPVNPSGIRIGTPAITTRGFKGKEATQIVHWIDEAIKKRGDEAFLKKLKEIVEVFCKDFPIYPSFK
ncbi:serine hydroxymethyltransferase [Candidatus Babeliales bacterium]|nr:serine hydroxymethyltransferase [Candidatus Babeliales bacterium]